MKPNRPLLFPSLAVSASLALAQAPGDAVFQRYDRNRDGRVTADELVNPAAYERFDLNRDGVITREEFDRVMQRSAPAAGGAAAKQIEAVIRQFDANGDGRLTREEAGAAPWFERFDANGDDVIDGQELARVRALLGRAAAGSLGGGVAASQRAITTEDVKKITSGPEVLKPGEVGIGRMIGDLRFATLDGRTRTLGELPGKTGLVIAMTSATCPVSKRYLPSLAQLERELAAQNLTLLLVNPFASETADEIKAQLAAAGIRADYVHDREQRLAALLQARTTTEVFLLDARRTLVYRGALDDQYGVNYNLDAPRHRYLHDAITALRRDGKPAVQATAAPGCELGLADAAPAAASPVTYFRDVARILEQNCVTCHRAGGIAPFALDSLEAVKDRARAIRRVVTEGTMPPWFAAVERDAEKNPWANDCSLAARDKADLLAWINSSDRPAGNPADAPAKRTYPAEWSIGRPDLIVPLSRAYDIQATGFMPYAFDVVQTELTEDKWVAAFEILPSEHDVVHHVIVKVHERDETPRQLGEGAGGYWALYVPGNGACEYPAGFARRLPAGATISFQIHYTPSGTAKKERLRLGLVFAKEPPRYEIKTVGIANVRIAIPPGAACHVETQTQRVPFDLPVMSFMPHMHVRGAAFRYEVTFPDGQTETLLDIPRYDFNWQLRYELRHPRLIARGSTMKITATYDNSAGNKANPDPTKLVRWGSQTVDEMMLGYVEYFTPVAAH